jgi:hypothetical protein
MMDRGHQPYDAAPYSEHLNSSQRNLCALCVSAVNNLELCPPMLASSV